MFSPIKQVFIVLLSFSSSLATKCASLNDPPFMVRPTLIDFNLTELKFYPSMISLDNNILSPKICIPKKTKDINVQVFNMITNKNEAKTMIKHVSSDCKCQFSSATCIPKKYS